VPQLVLQLRVLEEQIQKGKMCRTPFAYKETGPWVGALTLEQQTLLLVEFPSLQKLRPIGLVLPRVESRFNLSGHFKNCPQY
jgi:hypothetical protein